MDGTSGFRSFASRLPAPVKGTLRRLRGVARTIGLSKDPPAVAEQTIASFVSPLMRDVARAINAAPEFPLEGVVGWLTRNEGRSLYGIARTVEGPFLEIGSWAGRSTCHIASGIRDSGKSKQFVTTDLNPTTANFRPHEGAIGFFYPAGSDRPRGTGTRREYDEDIAPVITSPGGVIGTLSRNLERHHLRQYVDVRPGHFSAVAPKQQYAFVFSDAMHDPDEIEQNAAEIRDLLRPGAVLACHDVTRDPGNEAAIKKHFRIGDSFVVDSLFVGQINS